MVTVMSMAVMITMAMITMAMITMAMITMAMITMMGSSHAGAAHADDGHHDGGHHAGGSDHAESGAPAITGDWYVLGRFGPLRLTIGYYIDSLTICMFCMVTLIATCIHFYAMGYMHDELHDFTDPEVTPY